MRKAILSVLLVLLSLAGPAYAADTAKPETPPMPAPLQLLAKQGSEIRYLGHDNGMDGWVTIKGGQEQYFYVTPDQQGIVLGVLFNNKGDIVTARQVEALKKKDPAIDAVAQQTPAPPRDASPVPDADKTAASAPMDTAAAPAAQPTSKAALLYADAENATWITLGQKTAPIIYSFIDPECPHCHDMLNDVRKSGLLESGKLQLRLIPVGLMNENSLKQAANLVASPNPAAALFKHLDGDVKALMADESPNTQSIQRNMVLMQTWKLDVTPFSIYKNKNGEIKILRGRPNDLKALVAELK